MKSYILKQVVKALILISYYTLAVLVEYIYNQ